VSGTAVVTEAEFIVGGMTCGACAARIERRLNRLDGVAATVNYATGRAYFASTGGRGPAELIGVIESAGYTAVPPALPAPDGQQKDPRLRALARRLAVCVPLAAAVIVLSMVPATQFPGWQWVSLLLTVPVATWGAWPLYRAAWYGLGHGAATMDTLVSVGVGASFGWSVYALLFGGAGAAGMKMSFAFTFGQASGDTLYLEAAAGVTAAVLAGRYLEARARDRSGLALSALAALGAKTVAVLRDGPGQKSTEYRIPAGDLEAGDLFVVRPGEKIATDGIVTEGRSAVDASLVTGESMPAEVGPGDPATGGTVNMSGRLIIKATQVGADTLLAQITRLVSQAQATKAGAQRLADKIAAVFVPCVIAVAVATLGFWLGAGLPAASACSAAVAVLVVACPCVLGLATPTALLAAVGRGAELGILIRSAQAIETAGRIRVLALDKTGTVTTGTMTLQAVITDGAAEEEEEVLKLAGAVEDASEHPIGQAIARAAAERLGDLPSAGNFTALTGAGVRGTVGGRDIVIARPDLLGLAVPASLRLAAEAAETQGKTVVLAGWDGQARAALVIADELKPHAAEAVARIRRLGIRPLLVTGDNEHAARSVADGLGLRGPDVLAGVKPEGKVEAVRDLQADGTAVALVGDGVNDAAALAQADLGLAVGSGADAAIGAADLTLIGGDPLSIVTAIELARATMGVIRGNLIWASGYNLVAIPLAALGYLNPLFAGVAMSASSLIVVGNSLRLRRFAGGRFGARPAMEPGDA
jgi:Cu+-exporting ATPase